MDLHKKTPEMNELEQDKHSLIFLAPNFEKTKKLQPRKVTKWKTADLDGFHSHY